MKMVSEPLHKAAPKMEEEDEVKAEQLNNAASQHDDVSERRHTEEEVVHAMKRVEVGPTPFLKKTFEMVEDPNTDPIVSWGEAHHSFVIWDSHQFSKTLLPKYFKHSNFSSFIRQLNTYGFKKVDSDRWEFANERFKGGKKHLLKSIKRRSGNCKKLPRVRAAFNSMKPGVEYEVEQLKKDQNMLRVEILNLTQQNEGLKIQLTNVEEQVRCAELKQYKMLVFLTRMAKNPTFVQQLIHVVKRHRLLATQCPVSFPKGKDTTPHVDCKHKGYEQLDTLLSESVNIRRMDPTVPSPQEGDDLCSSVTGSRTIGSGASMHDVSYAYDVMSEKLMGESSVVEVDVNVTNIYHELEDLIRKQDGSRLVGQSS